MASTIIRILFIYGYCSSPQSGTLRLLREALPSEQYEIICPQYEQEDITLTREFMHNIIREQKIDLVVGVSLGGFITLSLETDLPRIAINPCMRPCRDLPSLTEHKDYPEIVMPSRKFLEGYARFEQGVCTAKYANGSRIKGLFALEDELLGERYVEEFRGAYSECERIPGGHHGNPAAVPFIVKSVEELTSRR